MGKVKTEDREPLCYSDGFDSVHVDSFGGIFDRAIKWLAEEGSLVTVHVFMNIILQTQFGTGKFFLTPTERKKIMSRSNMTPQSLCAALRSLERRRVIAKVINVDPSTGDMIIDKYAYMVNPDMYWRGDPKFREIALKLFNGYIESGR